MLLQFLNSLFYKQNFSVQEGSRGREGDECCGVCVCVFLLVCLHFLRALNNEVIVWQCGREGGSRAEQNRAMELYMCLFWGLRKRAPLGQTQTPPVF